MTSETSDFEAIDGADRLNDQYFALVEEMMLLPATEEDRRLAELNGLALRPETTGYEADDNHDIIMGEVTFCALREAITSGQLPLFFVSSDGPKRLESNRLAMMPNLNWLSTISSGQFVSGQNTSHPMDGKTLYVRPEHFARFASSFLAARGADWQEHRTGPISDLLVSQRDALEKPDAGQPKRSNIGGSKPKAYWEGAINHVWETIFLGDFKPAMQSQIECAIRDWVVSQDYDEPSVSMVRQRAKLIWTSCNKG